MGKKKSTSPGRLTRSLLSVSILAMLVVVISGAWFYRRITKPVIDLKDKRSEILLIGTGSDFGTVKDSLLKMGILTDEEAFTWLSERKKYTRNIRPGRYRILDGMRNNELVNLLRSGNQEPVRLTIRQVNTAAELAGRISRKLEMDSARLMEGLMDREFQRQQHLSSPTLLTLFIPDTYEVYWNVPVGQFLSRMSRERELFWNDSRRQRARSLGLTIAEVVTLASIVEKETNKQDEKPVIAGVYLNRLRKGMPLQADPTVIFAWNDYSIRRVMRYHTAIQSPYNTYYRTGLPPGPICLPSVGSIDAVLHAGRHNYLYFCAREDLSGYHNFAADMETHTRNARKFQRALDKMNIR